MHARQHGERCCEGDQAQPDHGREGKEGVARAQRRQRRRCGCGLAERKPSGDQYRAERDDPGGYDRGAIGASPCRPSPHEKPERYRWYHRDPELAFERRQDE